MKPGSLLWAFLICGILLVLCFYRLGSLPLFDQDEPRYASAARTMVETGNCIVPYFNGKPRYQKPIFIYWLMCASYKLLGITELAARLPSALAVITLVLVTLAFGNYYLGADGGVASALALATCFGVVVSAHAATTDAVLHFLIAGAFLAFFHAEQLHRKGLIARGTQADLECNAINTGWINLKSFAWYLVAYALSGLAVLTKGPIGILLPVLGIGLYWLITGQFIQGLKRAYVPIGLGIIALINLPWWTMAARLTHGEFLRVFFLRENVQRFASGGHPQPFWYFLPILFIFFFPWSAFVPQAWLHALRNVRRLIASANRSANEQLSSEWLAIYCTCWSLSIIGFFSLSKGKNPQYILPSFTALALLFGWWWMRYRSGEWMHDQVRRALIGLTFLSILLGSALLVAPFIINAYFHERFAYGVEWISFGWGIYVAGIVALLCIPAAWLIMHRVRQRHYPLYALLAMLMFIFNFSFAATVAPAVARYRQEPLRQFAQAIARQLHPQDVIVVYRRDPSSVVYYSHHVVHRIGDIEQLKEMLRKGRNVHIIAKRQHVDELLAKLPLRLVASRLGYAWLSKR